MQQEGYLCSGCENPEEERQDCGLLQHQAQTQGSLLGKASSGQEMAACDI